MTTADPDGSCSAMSVRAARAHPSKSVGSGGFELGQGSVGQRDRPLLGRLALEQQRREQRAGGGDAGEDVERGLEAVGQRGAAERARARRAR